MTISYIHDTIRGACVCFLMIIIDARNFADGYDIKTLPMSSTREGVF
jgi:hypothetical protein